MKLFLFRILILLSANSTFLFPSTIAAQVDLGAAANYCLFTGIGAINNTGTSHFTGNIGTDNGTISNFGPPTTHTGMIVSPGSATATVTADLIDACTQLRDMPVTTPVHSPVFGNGETILPGVHFVSSAGSLNGVMMLDANENPNSVFIFRIEGAFTADAFSSVILIDGAKAANVFFLVNGEIIIAEGSDVKGNWIANDGSASMGAGSNIDGRLLSVTGAINVESMTASIPANILLSEQTLHTFKVNAEPSGTMLSWSMLPGNNTTTFEVERAATDLMFHRMAIIAVRRNETEISYRWLDSNPISATSYYRVKVIAPNNVIRYSEILKINTSLPSRFVIYPNPITNRTVSVSFKGRAAGKYQIHIHTRSGVLIMSKEIKHNGTDKSQSIVIKGNSSFAGGYLTITDPQHTKHIVSFLSNSN